MSPSLLTQARLIVLLRDELDVHVGTPAIHKWIREGMPTAPAPGSKPRFVWTHVRDWLLGVPELTTPQSQQIRDRLFKTTIKRRA